MTMSMHVHRSLVVATLAVVALAVPIIAGYRLARGESPANASVLRHHRNAARDGQYVDASLTREAAVRMHVDPSFAPRVHGPTYAQLLYWADGRRDLVIAATEQNQVSAFDAATGAAVWQRTIGPPVPRRELPCGNIDPLGITGTPVIDPASRTLFVAAMTTDRSTTKRHVVAALSVEDGAMKPRWPVDVSSVSSGPARFGAATQNQRGALAVLDDTVYVPYGGHFGDCGDYHGWVVGVPIAKPGSPRGWATRARGGGIWAPSGVASDGRSLYVATGNTDGARTWSHGEAIIRLGPGPTFSDRPADFFAPANWLALDDADRDLGGSGPVLIHVDGAKPADLVVALGKDGFAYLVDRDDMGGIGHAVAAAKVSDSPIINAATAYTTARGTYVAFRGACAGVPSGNLGAIRIGAGSPPTITRAWCAAQHGSGSPIATTTDGRANPIVWSVGAEGDNRLRGFDGDTGQVVFGGGGAADAMSFVRRFQTPIVAKGRILVATDDRIFAFTTR